MFDFMYKTYTLESHLKYLSDIDKDYEILNSIWHLNKQNLQQGLSLIYNSYPNFSKHDMSHSMTILNNIQCFLGYDRIKRLGATDTFLILMSCLTHDIGMILSYQMVSSEWSKSAFKNKLVELSQSSDQIIANASKLLLSFQENNGNVDENNFQWALEIKNAVVILTTEIFRNKHAEQSANNILLNEEFKKLANNFYSDQLPSRFTSLLANIALFHGRPFNELINGLYKKANGYKRDYIHPRFIACMLRLGDLLDFDNNRFNLFSIVSIKEMPETSLFHKQKHEAVKHMLISPANIEAELDCPDEKTYRISRAWFDWLEEEVNHQAREWTNIVPDDLGGLSPTISKDSIKILYKGAQTKSELLNLKFTMSQKRMFDILSGGGIYKEPGLVFIREIVQNAIDASKIQLWNDIKDGLFDLKGKDFSTISFPDDIPDSVYQQYPINLRISWDDQKNIIHVECEDKGTGISEVTILRMTKFVGDSYKKDQNFIDNYNNMPYWLRPTAAFGIGLQSIFFVTDSFDVETSFPNEKPKKIIFRPAKDNQYCSLIEENIRRQRGTVIKVDIRTDKLQELFGEFTVQDVLINKNEFSPKLSGQAIKNYGTRIDLFVKRTLQKLKFFNLKYKNEITGCVEIILDTDNQEYWKWFKNIITDRNYKFLYKNENGYLVFYILEAQIGSTCVLWFDSQLNQKTNIGEHSKEIFFRDIPISNAYFVLPLLSKLHFKWNILTEEADNIVTLSRNELSYKGLKFVHKILYKELFPKFLDLIAKFYSKEYKNLKTDRNFENLEIQYFNFCLTLMAFKKNILNKDFLEEIELPVEIISLDGRAVHANIFFEKNEIILVDSFNFNYKELSHNEIKEENEKLFEGKLVIWSSLVFGIALDCNFICKEIYSYRKDCRIYLLEKESDVAAKFNYVKACDDYLKELDISIYNKVLRRKIIYGLDKYQNIIIDKKKSPKDYLFPPYSLGGILSPFQRISDIDKLFNNLQNLQPKDLMDNIKNHLSEYVDEEMIEEIKYCNIQQNVTEDKIKEDYVNLILEFYKLRQ